MKIRVWLRGEEVQIEAATGARLLEYLQSAEVPVNASCGGKGTCFKCRVRVKEGFLPPGSRDRVAFREGELQAGWRLSCQAMPRNHLTLEVPFAESIRGKPHLIWHGPKEKVLNSSHPRLVCDLGSTGVVLALVDSEGTLLVEAHLLNRQVRFGSDVMTRLAHAQKAGSEPLTEALLKTLVSLCEALHQELPGPVIEATRVPLLCAGNSAMVTFLLGMPTESLATSPFQPSQLTSGVRELSLSFGAVQLQTLPLMGGFIGGDTVAGIALLESRGVSEPWMLVDIGTNTEIVVNNGRGELWFASAPAGPAFEGGNISQGMRAENGAISRADWDGHQWQVAVIGNDLPRGICGSGLMDLLSEGVRSGLIQRDGLLPDGSLPVTPEVQLLADDVREFQLAKSATRTAAELLIQRSGVKPLRIYLAGTFAEHLRPESVKGVGLLPEGIPFETLGNGALLGTAYLSSLSDSEREALLSRIESRRCPVELALQDDFQDGFVRHLNF